MNLPAADDLSYALRWRVRGLQPGAHRAAGASSAGVFRQVVPFDRSPDARRLDLRRSLRDPFGQWFVREYEPRANVTVTVLVDVSGSMAYGPLPGTTDKLALAARLCAALASAARAIGDPFGLYACGVDIAPSSFPPRRNGPRAETIAASLRATPPRGDSARGLIDAAALLAGKRKLVFLLSDFAFPLDEAARILDALWPHDVVPVVLDDDALDHMPRWGLADVADLETGRRRLLVLRPSLLARWREAAQTRAAALARLCADRGYRPFRVPGALDVDAFGSYLAGR